MEDDDTKNPAELAGFLHDILEDCDLLFAPSPLGRAASPVEDAVASDATVDTIKLLILPRSKAKTQKWILPMKTLLWRSSSGLLSDPLATSDRKSSAYALTSTATWPSTYTSTPTNGIGGKWSSF
ncbi:hypothetical protein CORC01_08365 [Colletotrichum orchidophilum]|uniref:Uncharacterized protein n=1 Tax=Colletotrichum orchidophilum TaxID=1209926 RepID=A0A1G4B4P5_9PEZI|nr:uncharacterized protein CORC01_08365 [Colletotrichum orchidophilum]OHE96293.1 hypothetical protein CORC01_08365 [Colletotrichum orchidophilum]